MLEIAPAHLIIPEWEFNGFDLELLKLPRRAPGRFWLVTGGSAPIWKWMHGLMIMVIGLMAMLHRFSITEERGAEETLRISPERRRNGSEECTRPLVPTYLGYLRRRIRERERVSDRLETRRLVCRAKGDDASGYWKRVAYLHQSTSRFIKRQVRHAVFLFPLFSSFFLFFPLFSSFFLFFPLFSSFFLFFPLFTPLSLCSLPCSSVHSFLSGCSGGLIIAENSSRFSDACSRQTR